MSQRQRMLNSTMDVLKHEPKIRSPELYERAVAEGIDDGRSSKYWQDLLAQARRELGIRVNRARKIGAQFWDDSWTRYGLRKGMSMAEQEARVLSYVSRRARSMLQLDARASSGDIRQALEADGFPFHRSRSWWKRTVARARMDVGIPAPGKGGTTKLKRSERHRFIAYARERLAEDPALSSTQVAKMARADGMTLKRSNGWIVDAVYTARKQMGIRNGRALTPKQPRRNEPDFADIPDLDGPKRLAAAVIELAVKDAGTEHLQNERKPLKARLAAAWLQSPECTAVWAGALGVDSDAIASRSEIMHGRPTFSRAELEVLS